ncbi:MAG: hypothetical protein ACOY5Y_20535 [Pseudomonadota bacterium]
MENGAGADGQRRPFARMVSAGPEDALERFSDPALLEAGKVNLISLEAVEARFGDRWSLRCEQVYDFAARVLERGVGASGYFLRVSSTDFFIVHPDLGRIAGQMACLRYLREVLHHFLGEDQMAAMGVLQVTKIAKGHVEAQQIDASADPEADAGEEAEPTGWEVEAVGWRTLDRWTPFVAADGRQVRVSAALEPVYELRGFTRIGFRMVRRVLVTQGQEEEELSPREVTLLSTADLLRVDLATIARGIERLRAESRGEQQLSLIVPLSFASLASQKGRAEVVKQLKATGGLVKLGTICEICDIEGVPPSSLLAAVSLVRPFAVLVVGRLSITIPSSIIQFQRTGLQALSFDCRPDLDEAEFAAWASATIAACKRVAKPVLVYRVPSAQWAGVLAALGASHLSITPI